jgi:hypothetical protein
LDPWPLVLLNSHQLPLLAICSPAYELISHQLDIPLTPFYRQAALNPKTNYG